MEPGFYRRDWEAEERFREFLERSERAERSNSDGSARTDGSDGSAASSSPVSASADGAEDSRDLSGSRTHGGFPGFRDRRSPIDFERRENALSALTLARTIAFLLYSLLVPLITLGLMVLTPLEHLSPEGKSIVALGLFLLMEWFLFQGVSRGFLPSPNPDHVSPFSERQMELGVAVLSFAPWLLRFDPQRFFIFQVVVNGFLILAVLVFFLSKSMLSRRPRWAVLRTLLLPAMQLAYLFWPR